MREVMEEDLKQTSPQINTRYEPNDRKAFKTEGATPLTVDLEGQLENI
jgi:hypothetical protein